MNRRFLLVLSSFSFAVLFLFLVALFSGQGKNISSSFGLKLLRQRIKQWNSTLSTPHRKLLRGAAMEEPNRIWGEKCTKADIVINQGPTAPLPSGIPTYTVEIVNVCVSGCDISGIHLNCGWFSSARLINPRIFKRIRYNDCLVNDGKPLVNGGTLSFQYANTFLYPLSVSRVVCS
ncbi:protein TAPETUM DETERMINANT 1 [Herrania umbratica]|uniref:Protein TAPETUM DETERMINANT 1 n=1 Tax=Herrania umbratica TaxID=108875 RepID=A0A6J1AJD7_9ROSI|nr:protein TAPETUM DETERMINANT 1 [Herrania umbratica]